MTSSLLPAAAADGADGGRDALARPVHASWVRLPVRDWADRLTALAGRPVIVDRRIDPDRLVTSVARGEPLRDVLDTVATGFNATVAELASTIRIVPPAAAELAVRADRDRRTEVQRLPASARAPLGRQQPWSWSAGAEPRELIRAAAAEARISVEGLDEIPHDHLPAAALPPLSLAERLDLVLAHYDRRLAWTAEAGRVVGRVISIGPPAAGDEAGREAGAAAGGSAAARPPSAPRPGGGRRPQAPGHEVFSLRLEAPLDQAVAAIADRLGLQGVIDAKSLAARGIAVDEIVRATVEGGSREELLDALVGPLELRWQIDAGRLRIFAPTD